MSDPGDFLYEKLKLAAGHEILRGSVVAYLRRCGKRTCACAQEPARRHPSLMLSIREGGRQRSIHLRKDDEARVRKLVENYGALRDAIEAVSAYEVSKLVRQVADRRRKRVVRKGKR
jgi:hypothetical protein